MNNYDKGFQGELSASNMLIKNGYEIICKNYRCTYGEIDIIARKNEIIVFVEVKSRTTKKFGYPLESVTLKKQNKIRNTALFYINENQINNTDFRFDVIELLKGENINHIENAF